MNQIIQSRLNIIIFLNSLSMIMWFYINLVNKYCRGCFITQGYFSYISLLLLTTPVFYFLNTLLLQDQSLLDLQVLHLKMAMNSMSHPNFMIHKGIIYYKGKTYLSKNSSLVPLFLQEFDSTQMGGHSSYVKTLSRIEIYWDSMHKDGKEFCLHRYHIATD